MPVPGGALAPCVLVSLGHRGRSCTTIGLVDSGADTSFFSADLAQALGFDLSREVLAEVGGVGGAVSGYRLPVVLATCGARFQATVFFCKGWTLPFGLLGRGDFFTQFDVGFDERGSTFLYRHLPPPP